MLLRFDSQVRLALFRCHPPFSPKITGVEGQQPSRTGQPLQAQNYAKVPQLPNAWQIFSQLVLKPAGDVFAAVAPQIFVVYEGTSDYATAGKTRRYMAVSAGEGHAICSSIRRRGGRCRRFWSVLALAVMDSATKVRRRLQTAKHFLGRFSLCSLRVGFYQTKHQGADSILLKAFISVFLQNRHGISRAFRFLGHTAT